MGHAEASLTLCCFPYAGGGPFLFRPWQARLGKRWNVVALSLPARGARISEPPVSDLQTIVDNASAGLDQIDGPWFAFGHSMGAIICFELARQRYHQGKRLPEALFVSGTRAPDMPQREALRFDLPDQEFVAVLRDLEGTPPELVADDQFMTLLMPALRADFRICETYQHRESVQLPISIHAFSGDRDETTTAEEISAWAKFTNVSFSWSQIPGKHFYLESGMDQILDKIQSVAQSVMSRRSWQEARAPHPSD